MEKMDCPLSDIVPELLKNARSSSTIDFGPVAVQLLKCVQAIQDRKHLVVDIKPENFMLSSTAGKGSGFLPKLASRIRILDLALVQPWSSIGAHRSNDGTSGLAGTPLYASLNLHNGETPSRRDDLEALGYVIAELIMKITSGNALMEPLPWSVGKSDDLIGQSKSEMVNNMNSTFYKQLGSPGVVKVIKEYFAIVRGYTFKKTPDYDDLSKLLSKIKIPTPKTQTSRKMPPSTKRSTSISTIGKRVTRSSVLAIEDSDDEDNDLSPCKVARDDSYMDTEEITNFQPLAATLPAHEVESSSAMDWEPELDENNDPGIDLEGVVGVTIVVDGGPHKGETVNLVQGHHETIVVGRNPTRQRGERTLALTQDLDVDDSHIKVELSITRKLLGVKVTDLKSSRGSFVGNERIRSGNSMIIYRGDTVRIGSSRLRVKNLDSPVLAAPPRRNKTPISTKRIVVPTRSIPPVAEPQEETALKRRGVRICVVDGPHTGESYDLEHGASEGFNIGSNPSGKLEGNIALQRDKNMKANHVHIELYDHKKIKAVIVTDKSKGETKVNRDTIKKTRAFINDRIHIGDSVLEIKSL